MCLQLFFKWISQKMHLLSTRMKFNQPIIKSPLAMYGLTKMSRRALSLFLIIQITPRRLFTPSCRNYLIPSTKNTVTLIKLFNVFTDGLTSQFKQCFSFSNLHGWKNEFNFKIVWNFFATSHGKGAVDGIGDTVQCSFWRNVRSTTAAPNDAVAYYELVKCINMGITIIYISSHTIQEKCAPRLPVWDNTLVVTGTMKLHCIKVRNSR